VAQAALTAAAIALSGRFGAEVLRSGLAAELLGAASASPSYIPEASASAWHTVCSVGLAQ